MDTVHVILWVVIVVNIASIVFNMLVGGSSSKLTRERFEQGANLGSLATLSALSKVIMNNPELKAAIFENSLSFIIDDVRQESEKMIKESTERIFR